MGRRNRRLEPTAACVATWVCFRREDVEQPRCAKRCARGPAHRTNGLQNEGARDGGEPDRAWELPCYASHLHRPLADAGCWGAPSVNVCLRAFALRVLSCYAAYSCKYGTHFRVQYLGTPTALYYISPQLPTRARVDSRSPRAVGASFARDRRRHFSRLRRRQTNVRAEVEDRRLFADKNSAVS